MHIWQSWNVVAVKTITYWISETNEVQDFVNLVKIKYTVTVLKHNIDILHISTLRHHSKYTGYMCSTFYKHGFDKDNKSFHFTHTSTCANNTEFVI